jgi:mono/diheme cytochrome c family protein
VLLALTGYEIALGLVALAFIVFALVAALVIPRSSPSFPGNRLGLFIAVCGAFFIAQMTAVLVLAEVGEADEPVHEETTAGGETTEPESTATETTETTETETTPAEGDAAAGKEVFVGVGGCGSCHTLSDAGTTGQIGPDLDAAQPSNELAVDRVTNGMGAMPSFEGQLTEQQIQDVAAYVSSVAGA